MDRRALAIILLVSLSHGMVHVWELVFPAIEQDLAADWHLSRRWSGIIHWSWTLPFGLGALPAGWLADRIGSRRVLLVYLVGAALLCGAVAAASDLRELLLAMFLMGTFASLYHPAGLAYISRSVGSNDLGRALGYHGIVGGLGIAGAPLIGAGLLTLGSWRDVYLVLAIPGLALATLIGVLLPEERPRSTSAASAEAAGQWFLFGQLCLVTLLLGTVYRGFMTFLPRHLGESLASASDSRAAGRYLAAFVLLLGLIGQYGGGWLCGRFRLEQLLVVCTAANVPLLLWMGWADGPARLWAAGSFSIVHFSLQPITNSLIACYTPVHRRSLGYGINFLVAFGIGSLGAVYAGELAERFDTWAVYPCLAAVALLATLAGLWVRIWARRLDGKS